MVQYKTRTISLGPVVAFFNLGPVVVVPVVVVPVVVVPVVVGRVVVDSMLYIVDYLTVFQKDIPLRL